MNDSEFQSFCYEEYKRSLSSRDDIYRRYPLAVTAIVVLATGTITLGSNRYLPHLLVRVDASLYYLGIGASLIATACATVWLMQSIFAKDYYHLDSTLFYHSWRESYRKSLLEKGYSKETVDQTVAAETQAGLTLRLAEATAKNIEVDRAGMAPYNRAMYAIGIAVVSLGLAAVCSWVMNYRGLP
jgi:hypothetical protein